VAGSFLGVVTGILLPRAESAGSSHRDRGFGAQPWLLASSLADTPFSCSRQIETDEQPTAISDTNATTKLRRPMNVAPLK
jgi:hypothetical protein